MIHDNEHLHGARRLPSDTRLFLFTAGEEARMLAAIRSARVYMKGYGKGRKPYAAIVENYRKYE